MMDEALCGPRWSVQPVMTAALASRIDPRMPKLVARMHPQRVVSHWGTCRVVVYSDRESRDVWLNVLAGERHLWCQTDERTLSKSVIRMVRSSHAAVIRMPHKWCTTKEKARIVTVPASGPVRQQTRPRPRLV